MASMALPKIPAYLLLFVLEYPLIQFPHLWSDILWTRYFNVPVMPFALIATASMGVLEEPAYLLLSVLE